MARRSGVKRTKLNNSEPDSKTRNRKDESESENESVEEMNNELDEVQDEMDSLDEEADSGASSVEDDESEVDEESDEENNNGQGEAPKDDAFGTAMSAILGSRVKAHDASNPILIRNKRSAKEIEESRQDAKARRAIRAERLQQKDKARVRDVIPKDPEEAGDVLSNEKKLRKVAQRGVVKLLNAIHSAQSAALQDTAGSVGDKKASQASTELSKEKFLDMIRMG